MAECACRLQPGCEHFRHHDSVSCSVFSPDEANLLLNPTVPEAVKVDLLAKVGDLLRPIQKWQRETYG